jgi:urea transport system permease protein
MITFEDQIFIQFLTGFSVVAILIIAALGLAIIFGIAGVINMAHGEFIMVGAYCGYILQQFVVGPDFGYTLFLAIPFAFVVVGTLGLIVERTIIQWIYDRPLETLLATWGVGIALQVIMKLIFGTELKEAQVPDILEGGVRIIGFIRYPYYRMFLIVFAIILLAAVFYLIYRTTLGLKVRAVRRNRSMTNCLGIDSAKVDMAIFVIGSGLAGVAGAVLAPIKTVSPTMGFVYAVDSFMVLVLGGVGSLWGVAAGAGIIGEGETILSFLYNNVIGKLLVFLMIVLAIRVFPRGLFGYHERR